MTLHGSRSDSSIEVHTMLACRQKMYLCRDTSITHACVLYVYRSRSYLNCGFRKISSVCSFSNAKCVKYYYIIKTFLWDSTSITIMFLKIDLLLGSWLLTVSYVFNCIRFRNPKRSRQLYLLWPCSLCITNCKSYTFPICGTVNLCQLSSIYANSFTMNIIELAMVYKMCSLKNHILLLT